jgi:hypothetical protein
MTSHDGFIFLYVNNARTLQEHTYGPPVTGTALLSYTDDVRTSLETQASTVCYGDSLTVLYR